MSMVRIVTDSSAELPEELIEEYAITVVPWRLQMGTETLVDGPNLRTSAFYRDVIKKRTLPTAMPPAARQFADVYSRLCGEAGEIVSIHGPAQLAPVVQAASQARLGLLGRCDINVVDAQFISRALGILVIEAARAAREGLSGAEVARLVHGMVSHTYLAFYVEAMDYLKRSGLVTATRDIMGGVAGFKPLLLLEEGEVVAMQRSRNRGTPVERLVEFIAEFEGLHTATVMHTGLGNGFEEIRKQLAELYPKLIVEEHIYGPVWASLVGPMALGAVVFEG
jgi:DegV family protein with EDD domain